jgi:hypothetical protein
MDFLESIKEHPKPFGVGVLIGVLVCLVLVWMYNRNKAAENYITASNLHADSRALLAKKLAADPISSKEGFKHNKKRAY